MDFEEELKKYLQMDDFDFGNVLIYMKELGIMKKRENIKLFISLLKVSHSKGFVEGIQFAKASREKVGLKNTEENQDTNEEM